MTLFSFTGRGLRHPYLACAAAFALGLALTAGAPASSAQNLPVAAAEAPASITGQRTTGPDTDSAALPIKAVRLAAPPSAEPNPYGLLDLWRQGDWVAKGCLLLLALMSVACWYALLARVLALRRLKLQTRAVLGVFKNVRLFASHMAKLTPDNPHRYVADAGSVAVHQYAALKPRVDYDTWLIRAIEQALSTVQTRLQGGMALLATVGSTAPFVGLFGTVWAIYTALVKIGASGQASIDRVAGPVGQALIMTAVGLAVAVPAVFGYNWLLRQNKLAFEGVRNFGAQLHSLLLATTDLTAPQPTSASTTQHDDAVAALAAFDAEIQASRMAEDSYLESEFGSEGAGLNSRLSSPDIKV